MTKEELVRLYNRLSWYFCTGKTPKISTKSTDSIETLQQELDRLYEEFRKKEAEKEADPLNKLRKK